MQYTSDLDDYGNERMRFDIKGSISNRFTKLPEEEKTFWRDKHHCKKCLKDINLV